MSAVAISEHGNVNSHAALERHCNNAGIKPIFGIEAYFGPVGYKRTQSKTHLGIYAMNEEGYHNLNQIVTQSYRDFYYWPTVSPATLRKYNAGLAILSGCSDSLIPCALLGGKFLGERRDPELGISDESLSKARRKIQWFLDVFGPERFFLEVQRFPSLDRTCAINETFQAIADSFDSRISLIATADVHYPRPTDNTMQAILHGARWKNQPNLTSEAAWEYQANLSYPESDKEIIDDLVRTGLTDEQAKQAVLQTANLARKCTVLLPKAGNLQFAIKKPEDGPKVDSKEFLRREIRDGLERRINQRPEIKNRIKAYKKRAIHEYKIICDKNFADYFLSVADLVTWAKENRVTVGPGRGSAAGSLVCYLLGITEIDPIHPVFSRMIFERFIDPNRSDMPDIDLDFDDEKRHLIAARARTIYGDENVANVANHIGYRGRRALDDVARAYKISTKTFEPIKKRIHDRVETDDRVDDSIADVIESYASEPEVAEICEAYSDQLGQAMALEGNQHSMGIHAGGFVIASNPIPEVCAIYTKEKGQGRKRETVQVIPYEKRDAEYLGMLKMDFLGLTTMGQIGKCQEWTGVSLDELYGLFYKDYQLKSELNYDILEKFREDDLTGIFQYEGPTTRQVVRDVQPETFDELAACNALSRPGPLHGGQTAAYIAVKNGDKDWDRIHETGFDRHVEWTYGQIVYQEQIMWILRDLAGFDVPTVLRVRKIIGKKLGEFKFTELWEQFRSGCLDNGVSEDQALRVWQSITTAAGYAFNTSHAYSYALVAWWAMYFKTSYPTEFFASALCKNGDGKDQISRRTALLSDAMEHDIEVQVEFDLDVTGVNWMPLNTDKEQVLLPGFQQIPGMAETTAYNIVAWRSERGRSIHWRDLVDVKGIGLNTVTKMIAWCEQDDPFGVFTVRDQLSIFRKQLMNGDFSAEGVGLPDANDFIRSSEIIDPKTEWRAWVGLVSSIDYKDEIEIIRSRTGKSFEEAREVLAEKGSPERSKKATLFAYDDTGECALRVSRWVYNELAQHLQAIKEDHHIVVAWGRTFEGRSGSLQVRRMWVFDPEEELGS